MVVGRDTYGDEKKDNGAARGVILSFDVLFMLEKGTEIFWGMDCGGVSGTNGEK